MAEPTGPAPLYTLAAALELRAAWARAGALSLRVRWPNDLWSLGTEGGPRGKVAGLLVDRIERAAGPVWVVGVGVNVRGDPGALPPELRERAAFLEPLVEGAIVLRELEAGVCAALDRAAVRLREPGGAGSVVAEAGRVLDGLGQPATIDGEPAGIIEGIDETGALLLRGPSGELVRCLAGSLALAET